MLNFFAILFAVSSVFAQNLSCTTVISRDLRYGDRGPDVLELQRVLNQSVDTEVATEGVGSRGNESEYFGLLTYLAVKNFQNKYIGEATGFVGPHTREKIEAMCTASIVEVSDIKSTTVPTVPISPFKRIADLPIWFIIVMVLGANFTLWGSVGLLRFLIERVFGPIFANGKGLRGVRSIEEDEVAAMMPAHNEELVIRDALNSLLRVVKPENIFVISDGSIDETAKIAQEYKVNVLDLNPNKGKAGALEAGIRHFDIVRKYKALILIDADTRLKENYLKKALPFFNKPDVVAVAGFAATIWNPKNLSWRQLLFISHRDRIYFLFQFLIKFGQTWRYTNVTHIIPGFASIYRTSVLKEINMNPPGLVIEDFNMTFEVQHKKLGKIVHDPAVIAYTQDPDNLYDYFRQVKRWHLGFWQTIRLHGIWPSKFWMAMTLTLIESISGSLFFLLMPVFIFLICLLLPFNPSPGIKYFAWTIIVGTLAADYLLTIIVAIFQRRPQYLVVGPLFFFLRFFDAVAFLIAIPRASLVRSSGRWRSPTRRTLGYAVTTVNLDNR